MSEFFPVFSWLQDRHRDAQPKLKAVYQTRNTHDHVWRLKNVSTCVVTIEKLIAPEKVEGLEDLPIALIAGGFHEVTFRGRYGSKPLPGELRLLVSTKLFRSREMSIELSRP